MPWWGLAAGLIVFGYFAWLSWQGVRYSIPLYRDGNASTAWPQAQATVVASSVVRDSPDTQQGKGASYSAQVVYEYQVQGVAYRNDRIRFGGEGGSSETDQREVAGRFPRSATVKVFYDPANPANSTLIPGFPSGNQFGLWLGVGLLGACLAAIAALLAAFWFVPR